MSAVADSVATDDVDTSDELDLANEVIYEHEIPSALGLPGTIAVRKAARVLAEHYGGRPTWRDVQQDAPLLRIAARAELAGDLTFVLKLKQRDPDYVTRFSSPHGLTQATCRVGLAQVRARMRRDDPQGDSIERMTERLEAVDPVRLEQVLATARRSLTAQRIRIAIVLRTHGKLAPAQFAPQAATPSRARERRAGRSRASARAPGPDGDEPSDIDGPLRAEGDR